MPPVPDPAPTLGVCYYPEHWPEEQWAEDAARMVAAGLTWVRIGEFAWSRLEPVPGDLRFDWLDRAVETLGAAGLRIVMGTPTATPPRWMLDEHPDMLAVDAEGRPRKFGSRRHYCFSHRGYRAQCARIVTLMAQRYGSDTRVAAWQTDNEYGCHDTVLSYSQAALSGFRAWLAERYGQIDSLNTAWGNVFWSMEYRTYDDIDLPNLTVTEANPAHVLDFQRYSSDQVTAFNRIQTDILRDYTSAPLIHNFMGRTTEFDHFAVAKDLDVASWDSYPLGFLEDRSDEDDAWKRAFMRQGDPDTQAFHHDLYRAVGRGRWWIMEQQPGPVNWAPYNPAPLPGMARLWAWEAFAHGAEAVLYFRWRQAPFGQEQMHAGLLRPDSQDAPALDEVREVARDLGEVPRLGLAPTQAAIVFDYESAWAWTAQPQGRDFDYYRLIFSFYRGLREAGMNVDFLPPDTRDLSAYALVLVPGLMAWTDHLRSALSSYKGVALIGPRSGSKTRDMAIPAGMPPDMPALDVTVDRVETLRPDASEPLLQGGAVQFWLEHCQGTADVLEETLAGHPVLTRNGNALYLAGWPDAVAMRRILGAAAAHAGLRTHSLPLGVRRRDAGGAVFYFNYSAQTVPAAELPELRADLPPAGLAWVPNPT
ncbi:MAG: beta-galactosidase [Pseudomonadota bacterium]